MITASYFQMQPLWMRSLPGRRFKVHMTWYSQNTKPFVYRINGVQADMPQYRHVAVDEHWVWTEGYATYLKSLGLTAEVHVVGPILWYLPEASPPKVFERSVAIFDVTPVKEAFAQQIGLPRNYYSTTNMIAFLEQAMIACERVAEQLGQPVLVLLKHKRSHGTIHDPRYIAFVDHLVAGGRIKLLPPQTSLYSLIAASSAVIVVPFSSPAYVASALKVPAIYHDATESIEATYERASLVDFTSGGAGLAAKLYAVLRTHSQETCHHA
jgi:polysaccharide biosynthesis PFTS motif protein